MSLGVACAVIEPRCCSASQHLIACLPIQTAGQLPQPAVVMLITADMSISCCPLRLRRLKPCTCVCCAYQLYRLAISLALQYLHHAQHAYC